MAIATSGTLQTAGDSNGSSLTGVSRATTTTDHYNIIHLYLESGVDEATLALAFSNGTWVKIATVVQTASTPDFRHLIYYEKYAGAGATFNVTWSATAGSVWRSAIVHGFSGVDLTTPIDATGTPNTGSSNTATFPGITTVTNGAVVVASEADFDGRSIGVPSGTSPSMTELSDFANLAVSWGTLASAGATGDKTASVGAGGSDWAAVLFALRPAGAAAQDTPELRGVPFGLRGDRQMRALLAR